MLMGNLAHCPYVCTQHLKRGASHSFVLKTKVVSSVLSLESKDRVQSASRGISYRAFSSWSEQLGVCSSKWPASFVAQ